MFQIKIGEIFKELQNAFVIADGTDNNETLNNLLKICTKENIKSSIDE